MKQKNKTIFLDRDGVINKLVINPEEILVDSPNSVRQFELTHNAGKALRILKKLGYLLILISNQPGIAKGYYNLREFQKIKKKMEKDLLRHNIAFDAQYYCLHHPNAVVKEYKMKCKCRKPGTKLVADAISEHGIDLKKSFFIGDGISDMQLAKKIGCSGIFIGNVSSTVMQIFQKKQISPFYIAHDLLEATNHIKNLRI